VLVGGTMVSGCGILAPEVQDESNMHIGINIETSNLRAFIFPLYRNRAGELSTISGVLSLLGFTRHRLGMGSIGRLYQYRLHQIITKDNKSF